MNTIKFLSAIGAMCSLLLLAAACDPLEKDPFNDCDTSAVEQTPLGSWTISGEGEWGECENSGSFDLGSNVVLKVVSRESAEGGVEYGLARPLDFGKGYFDLVGAQAGTCVNFTTSEETARDKVEYRFDGRIDYTGRLVGDFTGVGPGTCKSSGTFSVDIR